MFGFMFLSDVVVHSSLFDFDFERECERFVGDRDRDVDV